jgi:hypothetical protein
MSMHTKTTWGKEEIHIIFWRELLGKLSLRRPRQKWRIILKWTSVMMIMWIEMNWLKRDSNSRLPCHCYQFLGSNKIQLLYNKHCRFLTFLSTETATGQKG